eukprot:SAG31_NODE_41746_length_274_cov_1.308571_1_plen_63_part_01
MVPMFCIFRKFCEIRSFLSDRQSESPLSRCFGSHQEICPVRVTCTSDLYDSLVATIALYDSSV